MQRLNNTRFSLLTPTSQLPVEQRPEHIPGARKRKRDEFESHTYKILPNSNTTTENMDKKYAPIAPNFEQEQIVIKTDKVIEGRSENLKDSIKQKSEKMLKFKSITQNVDNYVELDEKVIDLENINDYGVSNGKIFKL